MHESSGIVSFLFSFVVPICIESYAQLFIVILYVRLPLARVMEINRMFSLQTTTVDSTTATMFNSAAYFSEDPAADRLFAVTNP